MKANLRHAVGSLLVVGLGGVELTGLERAWLKLVRPAGVILFRRNIADAHQTRALLADATQLCVSHSLRCVDVEGGTVDRLRDALAPMPSAQSVAQAARTAGKPDLARKHGELVARAVRAFGFNTTLAPVLDLGLPASAAVMGTRCASPEPAGVITYAREFLQDLKAQDIVGCGKHYPGLGGGMLDSHLETPSIQRSTREIWQRDLAPYRELRDEFPMVMIGHAAYPRTPGRTKPASVSPYWITSILRKKIGYRGLILSDDLEMGGILKHMPIEEASIEAVRAGMDLLEICHSPELILRAYEALLAEAERSPAFAKSILKRATEATRKRARLFDGKPPAPLSGSQLEALRAHILQFSQTVSKAQPAQESQPA